MISINTNPSVLTIQRNITKSSNALHRALERISTGYKINSAQDDAAGLYVATMLNTKIRGLAQAKINTQNGISYLNTASSSLAQMNNILARLRDLAVQGSNGIYDDITLTALQKEAESLTTELYRIKESTSFNGKNIFETDETLRLSEADAISQGYSIIKTVDDLNNIRNDYSGKYILMSDIDLQSYSNWKPIGENIIGKLFTGIFDGNGYSITNLKINRTSEDFVGLFGAVLGAEIKNVKLENIEVKAKNYSGGLVGVNNNSKIINCTVSGKIKGTNYIGGLTGYNYNGSEVSNCKSAVNVMGGQYVGGLIGVNKDNVNDCKTTGIVEGSTYVGGLIGLSSEGTIKNCSAFGNIKAVYSECGGLIGKNGGTLYYSFATGKVNSHTSVGGLVGQNYGYIHDSFAQGDVFAIAAGGGLVGDNRTGAIICNSFAEGNVIGNEYIGGLVGYQLLSSTLENSFAIGKVQGDENKVGALAGYNNSSVIRNCFWNVDTTYTAIAVGEDKGSIYNSEGLSNTQMKDSQYYLDAGWSEDIWDFSLGMPKLKNIKKDEKTVRLQIDAGSDPLANSIIFDSSLDFMNFKAELTSINACLLSIDRIDELINTISSKNAEFGTILNRLDSVHNLNINTTENLYSAKSSIMDADIAYECAKYIRNQILRYTSLTLLSHDPGSYRSIAFLLTHNL